MSRSGRLKARQKKEAEEAHKKWLETPQGKQYQQFMEDEMDARDPFAKYFVSSQVGPLYKPHYEIDGKVLYDKDIRKLKQKKVVFTDKDEGVLWEETRRYDPDIADKIISGNTSSITSDDWDEVLDAIASQAESAHEDFEAYPEDFEGEEDPSIYLYNLLQKVEEVKEISRSTKMENLKGGENMDGRCGPGEHWVPEHRSRNGRTGRPEVVRGHCARNPRPHRVESHESHSKTGRPERVRGYEAE